MEEYDYYFLFEEWFSFEGGLELIEKKIFEQLGKSRYKFSPVFEEYEKDLRNKLSNFEIEVSKKVLEQLEWTFLINESSDILLYLTYLDRGFQIKIFTNSKEDSQEIRDILLEIKEVERAIEGSFIEDEVANRLKETFTKDSPNAKKLSQKEYLEVIKRLYDNNIREYVKRIANAYSSLPLTLEILKMLNIEEEKVEALIKNSLIQVRYSPICNNGCESQSNFLFESEDHINNVFKSSSSMCSSCKSSSWDIEKKYLLHNVPRECVDGLWLENLAKDVFGSLKKHYWFCKIHENSEYDGVSVIGNKVAIVECKDTNFGQNDMFICMAKAEKIGAEIIFVITTKEVHENVKSELKAFQKTNKKEFYLISSNDSKEIREEIGKIIENKKVKKIEDLEIFRKRRKSLRELAIKFAED